MINDRLLVTHAGTFAVDTQMRKMRIIKIINIIKANGGPKGSNQSKKMGGGGV